MGFDKDMSLLEADGRLVGSVNADGQLETLDRGSKDQPRHSEQFLTDVLANLPRWVNEIVIILVLLVSMAKMMTCIGYIVLISDAIWSYFFLIWYWLYIRHTLTSICVMMPSWCFPSYMQSYVTYPSAGVVFACLRACVTINGLQKLEIFCCYAENFYQLSCWLCSHTFEKISHMKYGIQHYCIFEN